MGSDPHPDAHPAPVVTMDTTAIRNMTPISTPTSEKKLLSFCVRIVRRASRTASNQRIRRPRRA